MDIVLFNVNFLFLVMIASSSSHHHSVVQGRVQLLEEERLSSTATIATKKEEAAAYCRDLITLREALVSMEAKLQQREQEAATVRESLVELEISKELKARAETREWEERRERIAAVAQLMATQTECTFRLREVEEKKGAVIEGLEKELEAMTLKVSEAQADAHKQAEIATGLETQVNELKQAFEHAATNKESVEKLAVVTGELEIMRKRVKEMSEHQGITDSQFTKRIAEYEDRLHAGEVQRRKLHNLVQELRGNIRVFARVRPFLPSDNVEAATAISSITPRVDINSVRIQRPARNSEDRAEDHSFSFDKVFAPSSSQETVFEEVSEFVQSALDGYNVCLFSYGQTGSGKVRANT
jgi:kinesin family protein C1